MVSIYKTDKIKYEGDTKIIAGELRGLSTDEKPTQTASYEIDNGSVFVEIDTGKIYFYDMDSLEWKEA